MKKGLIVEVYRNHFSDCTNRGESSKFNSFCLTGEEIEGPFAPSAFHPEMHIETFEYRGTVSLRAIPETKRGKGAMFGGNFIWSSDSRFPSKSPIKIFDRVE